MRIAEQSLGVDTHVLSSSIHYRPFGLRMTGQLEVMSRRVLFEHISFQTEINIQSTSFVNACFAAMYATFTF